MSPALAIAPKDLRLPVRDKGALFWACVLPIAFWFASLASGAVLASRARTERRRA